jgi:hypothetical protein
MSLLKYVERIKRIDYFLKKEHTGNSDEFAGKIGISRSMLMENLKEMKELGAKISYCHLRRSYFYEEEFGVIIGRSSTSKLKGGRLIIYLDNLQYTLC